MKLNEWYDYIKNNNVYKQGIEELYNFYETSKQFTENKEFIVSNTICYYYGDDIENINESVVDKIFHIMAIMRFLYENKLSLNNLTDEMRSGFVDISTNNLIEQYKDYFSEIDYKELSKDLKIFNDWVKNCEN